MEIIGFILSGVGLAFLTGTWLFMILFDGAFGKRDIPLVGLLISGGILIYLWSLLVEYSPFSVVIN